MPDGGTIQISCENHVQNQSNITTVLRAGNYIKLRIQDSGVGIPENMLGRIFDPYFSTKQKGSGLGLAISHSIINKHKGQIHVASTPGIGSIFTLFLPASEHSFLDLAEEKSTDADNSKARIMVMDDEDLVRDMSQAMLKSMGHEVVLARDGDEALSLYEKALQSGPPIDVIIMDLTIPGGMGGKEAVRELLSLNPSAKVIVSSGYSTDPIMSAYQEYGFCGTLVKPYQRKDMARAVSDAFTIPKNKIEPLAGQKKYQMK